MGSVTDWITAAGAVTAVAAAIWAGLTSRALLGVELKRDHERERRARAEQATLVGAWSIYCREAPADEEWRRSGVMVRNGSHAPVYDVSIASLDKDGASQAPLVMTILPPGEFVVLGHSKFNWSFPMSLDEIGVAVGPITRHADWRVAELNFIDAQGSVWRRCGGDLAEIGRDYETAQLADDRSRS